jgi:hypothetical protein
VAQMVQKWLSEDGTKEFGTRLEALTYDISVGQKERLDRYIKSKTWGRGRDTVARGMIAEFLAFEMLDEE